MADYQAPSMGHNSQAFDLDSMLDPVALHQQFTEQYATLTERRDELLGGVARFHTQFADGIPDDTAQGRAADFVRQIKAAAKITEGVRETVKRPLLTAVRTVDGFFKANISDKLVEAARSVEATMTSYAIAKADAARREAEAKRQAAEAEAQRIAAAAARTLHPELVDQAMVAERQADRLRREAPAERGQSRGEQGGVGSLRVRWTYRVTDETAVPRELMSLDEQKVQAQIAAGVRVIPGLEIYQDAAMRVR